MHSIPSNQDTKIEFSYFSYPLPPLPLLSLGRGIKRGKFISGNARKLVPVIIVFLVKWSNEVNMDQLHGF